MAEVTYPCRKQCVNQFVMRKKKKSEGNLKTPKTPSFVSYSTISVLK